MPIAFDVMGGDSPLSLPVEGAIQAVNDFALDVVLVGDEAAIHQELKKYRYDPKHVRIVNSSEMVGMGESPVQVLRQKKDSSIRVALNLQKAGEVDAVVSAGNTGATMATAKYVLKMIKGVDRPAIASLIPSVSGRSFVLLDIGANTDCKPYHLLEFALMGESYAQTLLHLKNSRVALLNNGEEEGKGNLLLKESYKLLKKSTLNFVGNIEGKAMYKDEADVVVCDGFVGNITLKVAEGTFDFIRSVLKEEISQSALAKLGYLAMRKPFDALKARADYTEVGGAPLLGVKGIVIICHGSSTAHTLRNAIRHANECVKLKMNDLIAAQVTNNLNLIEEAESQLTEKPAA